MNLTRSAMMAEMDKAIKEGKEFLKKHNDSNSEAYKNQSLFIQNLEQRYKEIPNLSDEDFNLVTETVKKGLKAKDIHDSLKSIEKFEREQLREIRNEQEYKDVSPSIKNMKQPSVHPETDPDATPRIKNTSLDEEISNSGDFE